FQKTFPGGVRIREAKREDAAAIARVHVVSWRSTYAGILPEDYIEKFAGDARERSWRSILGDAARRELVCVAEDESGAIVGFASGGPARGGAKDFSGELYAVYLLDAFQRRGVGRRLAGALARRLLNAGHDSMIVWVLAPNRSRGFYAALGGAFAG